MLTKEQIKYLDASELSKAVLIHYYGYKHVKGGDVPDFARHRYIPTEEQESLIYDSPSRPLQAWLRRWYCVYCGTVPNLLDDLSLAWSIAQELQLVVFPRMSEPGWCAALWNGTAGWENPPYFAKADGVVYFDMDSGGKGKTPAEAILRAALIQTLGR